MKLMENFTLYEMYRSETAERLGIDNTPPSILVPKLKLVAANVLEPVRAHYFPIIKRGFRPNSGYRSEALEKAICWGGDNLKSSFALWCIRRKKPVNEISWKEYFPNKQHPKAESVDFEVPTIDNFELAEWCRSNLDFDQLILEFYQEGIPDSGWVHVSYTGKKHRRQILTINRRGQFDGLVL